MEKEIRLTESVIDEHGKKIATMVTTLQGDGKTPDIITYGDGSSIIGYDDNGKPIVKKMDNEKIKAKRQAFMAVAIKEEKKLCVENGVDPDVVNIIGAEKERE